MLKSALRLSYAITSDGASLARYFGNAPRESAFMLPNRTLWNISRLRARNRASICQIARERMEKRWMDAPSGGTAVEHSAHNLEALTFHLFIIIVF